jgi:hypothetical protein
MLCNMSSGIFYLTASLQYISINDRGKIGDILKGWPHKDDARISVVTDGVTCLFPPHPVTEDDVVQARAS